MNKKLTVGLLGLLALCLSNFVLAAVNLNGTWKGSVKKLTDATSASCAVSVPVTLTITQCAASNLFKGTLKVGTVSIKVIGKLDATSNVQAKGSESSLTGASKSASLFGKYTATPATIQVNEFDFIAITDPLSALKNINEMYDSFTLKK